MSFNPFDGQFVPENFDLTLLDREADFYNLDSKCSGRRILNYRYISPRGMGKSTLLEAYFSPEKCGELAQKHQLVKLCRFSGDEMRTDADVFVRLIEAVEDSLLNLDPDSQDYERLTAGLAQQRQKHSGYTTDPNQGESLLKDMLNFLQQRRYYVTLVLDEFHQLACAGNLADTTFSKMASIAQKKLISYIVASDYDDEVGSETYYISPFSRIFSNATTHLEGITTPFGKKELMGLIRAKLGRHPQVEFTDSELLGLIELTGGIPGLIQGVLKDLFEIKLEQTAELSDRELEKYALSACQPLLEKWVQYFDDARWETMAAVIEEVSESAIGNRLDKDQDRRTSLTDAGLIVKDIRRQEYRAVCPLFEIYVRQELPRRKKPEQPASREEVHTVEYKYYFGPGTKFVQGNDQSSNLTAQNVQIQNGITASDLLKLLSDGETDSRELFAARLSAQLRGSLESETICLPPQSQFSSVEAYEQSYDEAFHKLSQSVVQDVPVDEDNDLLVTPAELQTLDTRFAQARTRRAGMLTDEILEAQSQRCQFYLKLSVIVEDALELPGIQMEDYSPQLVLYGKALEQALRDNFYELFHREQKLSTYDTRSHCYNGNSSETFGKKAVDDTMIGGYAHLIAAQSTHLASLCQTNQIKEQNQTKETAAWTSWWNRLQNDIHEARRIRNLADHASPTSPDRQSLQDMCTLIMGSDAATGILPRLCVGSALQRELYPPVISFEVVQRFVNNSCAVLCTAVKTNGGIKAVIRDGGYVVSISSKRVQAFCTANGCQRSELLNRELVVKVLKSESQGGKDFFTAEIQSCPALTSV